MRLLIDTLCGARTMLTAPATHSFGELKKQLPSIPAEMQRWINPTTNRVVSNSETPADLRLEDGARLFLAPNPFGKS